MLLIVLLFISILSIIILTTKFGLHPFLALLSVGVGFGLLSGMPLEKIVESINTGFGRTLGHIGIVIICGTIIGTFLEHSGGAFAMAKKILKVIGQKHVPLAMTIVGYFVSIPVFADSGFVILSPLNRALSKAAKISLAGSAVALAMGLIVSHCLVPPTPGPIAAAGILEANLGLVILLGLPVSIVSLFVGWLFATKIASKTYIDPEPEITEEQITESLKTAPSAFKAFLPILTPIVLIIAKSVVGLPAKPLGEGFLAGLLGFIGEPVIALFVGVLLAFMLPKKLEMKMLSVSGWVGEALLKAAIIIMVTGAGGAFGMVLRNSGIAETIGDTMSKVNLGIWLPFLIAISIKTAQGSGTVGLITTASLMAPLMESFGFVTGPQKALVVLAIGAGSMGISHPNDSFFWVVTQMSGMNVKVGTKIFSSATLVLGVTTGCAIWLLSLIVT